ncbi:MAG: lytic transglycosylase [Legionellales bacterium RIFCSPHIGHO2_12_FULL_37_14]|nr:MAG: lytic transglycosylase [Legionellales bacterium RIFCSPHIGHO2_12_FULL_37_14]
MKIIKLGFFVWWIFLLNIAYAQTQSWQSFVSDLRKEALSKGIRPEVFDDAFKTVHEPNQRIKHFQKSQPEKRLTYTKYLKTRVNSYRITMGRRNYLKNQELLEKIAAEYGVDPCFITAFWGMETSYGTYMGDFPVIQSLATLAYDSTRQKFFRKELLLALQILNEGHVSLHDFKGEWAGASGQPQFLPSSFYKYAVDYDNDGRKNIWTSKADVFASIANYMHQNGWQKGEPWAIKVKLPANFDKNLEGKKIVKPVSEWSALNVRTLDGQELPYPNLLASIVEPNEGPVFLALPNYKMILKYNNSIYYAGAIGYLADNICNRKDE